MCKILAVTGTKPDNLKSIQEKTWKLMSETERNGYGSAWDSEEGIGRIRKTSLDVTRNLSFVEGDYHEHALPYTGGSVIVHGRTATCGVNLQNTHPFVIEGMALVHNGVVSSKKYGNVISTCDSELILQAFIDGGIKAVEKHITGWYACFILEKAGDRTFLHIFKDDVTKLHVGELHGEFVFATTPSLIENIGAKVIGKFKDNTYCRFEGNRLLHQQDFVSKKSDSLSQRKKANKALGYYDNDLDLGERQGSWA